MSALTGEYTTNHIESRVTTDTLRPAARPGAAARGATVIMGGVVGQSFLLAFGNVWLLALRLGVPGYVAPLVAPSVDLSVVGLLGVRRDDGHRVRRRHPRVPHLVGWFTVTPATTPRPGTWRRPRSVER
ncbi:hypothetical protein [Frankia gtarii]|uniref:hypothetical protein n=1 Tax=Frankia gtarii TaxID=2950102 RepID=UPI0021C0FEDA|nr:hypothetical protein [Frankia gtarii]